MSGAIAVIAPTDAKRMWSGGPLRLCSSIRKGGRWIPLADGGRRPVYLRWLSEARRWRLSSARNVALCGLQDAIRSGGDSLMAKRGTLRRHPKTMNLARRLGIMPPYALGVLEALWAWVAKYAPTGDVTEADPRLCLLAPFTTGPTPPNFGRRSAIPAFLTRPLSQAGPSSAIGANMPTTRCENG